MTRHQALEKAQVYIARTKRSIRMLIRDSLKWIHLLAVILALRLLSDHTLEALIIVMFFYEVGFEFTAVDKLMEYNNKLRSWLLKKFSNRRKKNAKRNYTGPIGGN